MNHCTLKQQTAQQTAPLRILHIEDNGLMAKVVALALSRNTVGIYDIQHVRTHAEAFIHAGKHPVDIVLLDLGLPDSRGAVGVQRIRTALPDTPVIVLSAEDDAATRRACYAHGASAFLSKARLDDIALEACLQAIILHSGDCDHSVVAMPRVKGEEEDHQVGTMGRVIEGKEGR